MLKGLELCSLYYKEVGAPALKAAFPEAMSRAAAKVSDMILSDIRAIEKKRGKDAGKP